MVWEGYIMTNKHEKDLIYRLLKVFHSKFWTNLIILFSISVMALSVFIIATLNFLNGTEDITIVVMCLCIFIVVSAVTIIGMKPFFRDMKLFKAERFEKITGEVIKYRRVVHGGDPDTINYYPTIRDSNKEWIEVEVKVDGTELNKIYHCIYLPNTKLAVCEELANLKVQREKV